MKKIEKDLIIGVINSAIHKAAKQFEKGILVSDSEFLKLLQQCNKHEHLFFFINAITIEYNQNQVGKPHISIICSAEGYTFKSSFIIAKPHGKFNSETPIAQQFYIKQIS